MEIKKRNAFLCVISAAFILFALTIYPLRLYTENIVTAGLDVPSGYSEIVNTEYDAGDYFIAQYDHLQSMEVWIGDVISGDEFIFQLFGKLDNGYRLLAQEYLPLPQDGEEGFITIPIDVDLEPGEEYIFTIRGIEAQFRAGYEPITISGEENAPAYQLGFYHDTPVEGAAVMARFHYKVALTKYKSAAALLVGAAAALFLALAAVFFYAKHPDRNTTVPVRKVLGYSLTPVLIAVGGIAAAAVWPLQLFDDRIADLITYELGILIFVLTGLYALWHKADDNGSGCVWKPDLRDLKHAAIVITIAWCLDFCAKYMNALNDHVHHRNEYKLIIGLCIVILLMGGVSKVSSGRKWVRIFFSLLPVIAAAAGAVAGGRFYRGQMASPEEEQYLLINELLRLRTGARVAVAAAAVSVLISVIFALIRKSREGSRAHRTIVDYIMPAVTAFLFIMMIINRNGRWWIIELTGLYTLMFIQYCCWEEKSLWLKDVCRGISLNFICMVIWSMLHRYYFAYYYSRFSMHFHTVTVTAYYLVMVEAAALTLLLTKWRGSEKRGFRNFLRKMWKELLLFATVTSYLLMALSRAGIGTGFIIIVFAAFIVFASRRHLLLPIRNLFLMAACVVIVFPMIFTGQRLISTTVHRPYMFGIEVYPDVIMRNPKWDSRWYMSIEVFTESFLERIIGGPGAALSQKMKENDDGQWVENDPAMQNWIGISRGDDPEKDLAEDRRAGSAYTAIVPIYHIQPVQSIASEGILKAKPGFRVMVADEEWTMSSLETGDYSNGRLDLYRAYLNEIQMTGHEHMGAVLPNGDLAVHAHNIFLQAAFDCGMPTGIMLLLFTVILFFGSAGFYLKRREEGVECSLLPVLMLAGFGITGMVEWIFHFCNPFTVALMMSLLPVLHGTTQYCTLQKKEE